MTLLNKLSALASVKIPENLRYTNDVECECNPYKVSYQASIGARSEIPQYNGLTLNVSVSCLPLGVTDTRSIEDLTATTNLRDAGRLR